MTGGGRGVPCPDDPRSRHCIFQGPECPCSLRSEVHRWATEARFPTTQKRDMGYPGSCGWMLREKQKQVLRSALRGPARDDRAVEEGTEGLGIMASDRLYQSLRLGVAFEGALEDDLQGWFDFGVLRRRDGAGELSLSRENNSSLSALSSAAFCDAGEAAMLAEKGPLVCEANAGVGTVAG